MKTRTRSIVPATAGILAMLMCAAAQSVIAQPATPPPGKTPPHQGGMKGMEGMHEMMGGPHHVLAMAYRDNLATFARALQGQVTKSNTVDLDLARPAVGEMRRSFDQIQQQHQAQTAMMGDHGTPAMVEMKQHIETHLTALSEHLTALESEVNAGTPDPKKVTAHTAEILKQCAGMSAMPAKPKPM